MHVKSLHLRDFRGFKQAKLELDPQLTVLVGENGVGKTSILDALAISLSQYVARLGGSPSKSRRLSDNDIRVGSSTSEIEIHVDDLPSEGDISWTLVKQNLRHRISKPKASNFVELNNIVRLIADQTPQEESLYLSQETIVVYYEQNRGAAPIPQRKRGAKPSYLPVELFQEGLVPGGIDLRRLTYWFQERETDELRRQRRNPSYKDSQLDSVRRAMTEATGLKEPYFRPDAPRGLCVKKGNTELHVGQLSTGERTFLALAGDLARRLAIVSHDRAQDPLKGSAIVLIDELELHLHPRWQRQIVSWLRSTFPRCQFIASTHSAQILSDVHADHIRILRAENSDVRVFVPAASYGRDSNFILLSILNGTERPLSVSADLRALDRAIADADNTKAQEILTRLEATIEGSPPEISIAKARLERRLRG